MKSAGKKKQRMDNLPKVTIYSDGSCSKNPGPGGWAAFLLFEDGTTSTISGHEIDTTNNRMEMRGLLEALDLILCESAQIDFYSDSKYLCKGTSYWLTTWIENDWITSSGTPVKNKDLWMHLNEHLVIHKVKCHWTRGHSGDFWNEKADKIAKEMCEIAKKEANE